MNLYRPLEGARNGEPCWALMQGQFPPRTQGEIDYPCSSTMVGVGLLCNPVLYIFTFRVTWTFNVQFILNFQCLLPVDIENQSCFVLKQMFRRKCTLAPKTAPAVLSTWVSITTRRARFSTFSSITTCKRLRNSHVWTRFNVLILFCI